MDITQIYGFLVQNVYLKAFVIFALFFICAKIVVYISKKHFMKIAEKTKTNVDNLIIEKTNKPVSFIIILIGLKIALAILYKKEFLERIFASEIINSIIVVILAYLVIAVFDILINNWGRAFAQRTKSKMDEHLLSLFHKFSKIVFIIFTILFILQIWGIKVGPLLAGLGIGGIAIAFALQSSLANIFGGISLILDKSIKVGDVVKLESGEMGTIYDVGLRATRIKTFDNEIIIVPNGQLSSGRIQNFVLPDPSIRVNVEFGTEYGADPEFVKTMAVEEVKKIKEVMPEPAPWILFTSMGDNALLFKIMFWVDDLSKKWPAHQEAITRIYRRLYKEGIGIPFPQRTVWTYNAGKAPQHSPHDRKYSRYNKKYNVTIVKKKEEKGKKK